MDYKQFLEIYNAGPEATYKLLMSIMDLNALLLKRTEQLEKRVQELEAMRNKNSRNSSKPPSSDEFVKPKSQRKKSGKASGGQKGHKGHTLKMSAQPDHRVIHTIKTCPDCGHSLEGVLPDNVEKRQVFDLPPLQVEVTEHLAESKVCPCCGKKSKASFPERITHPVQYGDNLKGLLIYLNQYQMIPYERLVELFSDIFNHTISEGTLYNVNRTAYQALETVEGEILKQLMTSPVIHVDETGVRVEGKRQWLHVTATNNLTYYAYHSKRGSTATDAIGILPEYQGISVHDFWKSYLNYKCDHALCNAHHLRELTGIMELTGQQWPQEMIDLLLEIKATVEKRRTTASRLEPEELQSFETRYDLIVAKGFQANPPPVKEKGKRGRVKQGKTRNMLGRLQEYRRETLAFMYDFQVPFDNNQAERDLRMMKVKQKISGVFRSELGSKMFCRIRSYISTARKNSVPILGAIKSALEGNPFVPEL
ncbi:MAG: IS66 family transposase [Dethiobacteria bacterium]